MDSTTPTNEFIPANEMKTQFRGTNDQFWATLRHRGGGPDYVKVGRKVFYRRSDVEAWVGTNRFTRTDRPVANAV